MNLVEEQQRGHEAELLLNNPLHKAAFDADFDAIIAAMLASAFGDEKTHNRLVIALQMLYRRENRYKEFVTTGKMAAIQVKGGAVMKIQGIA